MLWTRLTYQALQINSGDCVQSIPSKSIWYRCIPQALFDAVSDSTSVNETNSTIKGWASSFSNELNSRTMAQTIFQDLYPFWWIILASLGIALVLSIIWLLLLRVTGSFFIWTTIGVLLLASNALAAFLIYNYVRLKVYNQELFKTGFERIDNSLMNENLLLALSILAVLIVLIVVILVCCSLRSLKIGIALLNETTKVFKAMPLMVLYPVNKYVIFLGVSAIYLYAVALLSTSGEMISVEINSSVASQSSVLSNSTGVSGLEFQPTAYEIIFR